MNKSTLILLLLFTFLMTACSGNAPTQSGPAANVQGGPATGELSASMQIALGTLKLDESENAVTAEQAVELLPLWQTLDVLYNSDTAATQEVDALITQIQETMTTDQRQAITALNLTRQDMMSIMQDQGMAMGSAQNANTQNGTSTTNRGGGFGPGGDEFQGPPPGGFVGGPDFQGQRPQTTDATDGTTRITAMDPNRVPTPLLQAVIEYLKEKSSS